MQLVLVSVALATTALVRHEASSPVEKVVKLLTDMKNTLAKEEKSDEEAYEKLSCWCETNDKDKTAAITAYEAKVEELDAEIEGRSKKAEQLEGDIAKTIAEIAQLKESKATAEEMRAKEGAENHAEQTDLTRNIESLKGAIIVLKKHQLTAFPQLHLDFLTVSSRSLLRKPDDLDKLSAWMEAHEFQTLDKAATSEVEEAVHGYLATRDSGSNLNHYSGSELAMLATAKKLVKNFLQAQPYANQSSEIFGILTQLKEQLEGDLSDAQKREAEAATKHADLMAQQKVQITETEKHLKNKETQQAENSKALVDAKEALEDAKNNLDSDSKFLIELKETCGKSDAEWELRSKTRKNEIAAVAEALAMLTADDNRDLFGTTYNFVQLARVSKRFALRNRASQVLRVAGAKSGDKALLALSASVQIDGFTKVKKAINDMIGALKQQQADEVKHKDYCTSEFHANDLETGAKADEQADLETKLDTLANTVETLATEIAAAKAAVADLEVQQQRASEDRAAESKVFQQTIEDQRATQAILSKVLSRLNEFYALAQTGKRAFLQGRQTPQEEAYKAKNVVAPVKFDEYKKSGGSSSVLTMIGNLIVDAKNLEKEAIGDENDAQQAYESFVAATNGSRSAKEQEVVNKAELKATAETEHEQATQDHKAVVGDLEELGKYKADLHKACDFVLNNFDVRQKARGEEMEALQSAMAILSGMQ